MATRTIRDQIETLAGAIRSIARDHGVDYRTADQRVLGELAEAIYHENQTSIAARFYMGATDRQWTRVVNMVHRSR